MKMFFFTKKNKTKKTSFLILCSKLKKSSYLSCKASNSSSSNSSSSNSFSSNVEKIPQKNNNLSSTQGVEQVYSFQKKKKMEIKSGDLLTLTVNSLISKKLGIAELSDGSTVFLPNTKLGDQVKAKIVQVTSSTMGSNYAVGEVVRIIKQSQIEPPVSVGEIFDLTINEKGPKTSGKVTFPNNYSLFIPKATLGEKVKVMITRVKTHYAFAKIIESNTQKEKKISETSLLQEELKLKENFWGKPKKTFSEKRENLLGSKESRKNELIEGSQWSLVLPKTTVKKSNSVILNFKIKSHNVSENSLLEDFSEKTAQELSFFSNSSSLKSKKKKEDNLKEKEKDSKKIFLFVKMGLGAKLGDKVRIKITKIIQTSTKNSTLFALAKILEVSPVSVFQKQQKIKRYLNKMLKNGMHFGDLKCHAYMKKFLWSKKKSTRFFSEKKGLKKNVLKKKDRHLLNLLKTRRCLNKAFKQLAKYAAFGRTFLFVGTKKPAAGLVARAALLSQNSFFVNTRWLGGMLTNWKTLLKSISKIQPIFREKQKILQNLLEKRHLIKIRLIKKINKLRNQSQQLLKKGKLFVKKIKQERTQALLEKSLKNSSLLSKEKEKREIPLFSPEKLLKKREQYLQKGTVLLKKFQQLLKKKNLITSSFQVLQEKTYQLIMIKKKLIKQYTISTKKIHQLQLLLTLSNELQAIKNSLKNDSDSESKIKRVLTVSSKKFTQLKMQLNDENFPWIVPNPPKEIIQKILNALQKENKKAFNLTKNEELNNFSQLKKNRVSSSLKSNDLRKTVLFSKFLTKFSHFAQGNFLKNSIKALKLRTLNQKKFLIKIQEAISNIQQKMIFCSNNQKKILTEIHFVQNQFLSFKEILKKLKKKFQTFSSSQKLLKFLPRLRYLSTPKKKILETVQIFMKKFVDPKLRYPMEKIYEDKLKYQSKKRAAARQQKWQRLEKYFGGVTAMAKLKNQQIRKNVVILIGQQEEMNAVLECKKLGIKMFHLVDTNCNPRLADHVIPSNDDSRNSIQFLLGQILTHIRLAQKIRKKISTSSLFS